MKANEIPTPFYIVYEDRLRANLDLISDVARRSGAKIIMAFKANALWKSFPIFKEYGVECTASSLNELQLGRDYLCERVHTYCPVYTDLSFTDFMNESSHITFNSLSQWEHFRQRLEAFNAEHPGKRVSPGIRVNPRCSVVETDLYNPALPGSRFGAQAQELVNGLPAGIEGLHFHALCEGSAQDLAKVLDAFESQFGHLLDSVKWVNMGGGHLMTRKGYDIELLIATIQSFRRRHPQIQVILEPGSAFTWQTGDLVTSVLDTVENDGIRTAIIDASFACHMPDTLEMPYQPEIAESCPESDSSIPYRLGGNSCLSGDFCGPWHFDRTLVPGQRLTLKDMNHYTTVKTTMFNGIQHPAIVLCDKNGDCSYLRRFSYADYRDRMC